MLDVKIDPLPWWDRFRACFTMAGRRSRTEYHRRLVAALVEFRLNDYEKAVTRGGNDDRRKVVQHEMSDILSGDGYLEKSGEELARAIEEGIQVRMPDEILWHQIACLHHAGQFAKDAYLTVNTASPQVRFSQTFIPAASQSFPFLSQPIKIVTPTAPNAPPMEAAVSSGLAELLRAWLDTHTLPEILYSIGPQSQLPSILCKGTGVNVVPSDWRPGNV